MARYNEKRGQNECLHDYSVIQQKIVLAKGQPISVEKNDRTLLIHIKIWCPFLFYIH